jgi:hypothetical protein
MSAAKHTPGPWWFSEVENGNYQIGQGDSALATTIPIWNGLQITERKPDEDKANAHLIAAAPELLEALEDAIDKLNDADMHEGFVARALDVIAKARGGK